MTERRLVDKVNPEPDAGWLEEVIYDELPDGDREVALKDRHLVATATAEADDRLLSGDGKAREKFVRLVQAAERLGTLHWVDPSWEKVRRWLLNRAPDHHPWTLGAEAS